MNKHSLIAKLALLEAELQEKNIIIESKTKENRLLQKQNELLQAEEKFTLQGIFVVLINTFLIAVINASNGLIVSMRKYQGQEQKMQEAKERKSKTALHELKSKGCEFYCNSRDKEHQGHKKGL
eukprot:6022781-Ditylum_brightwellii.AAC.1